MDLANSDQVIQEEDTDTLTSLCFSPPPMKHSETRDSISSIDSDVSLSYDHGRTRRHREVQRDESDSDAGSNGGKDSGCEIEHKHNNMLPTQFTPPTEELAEKICQQVEFYFSDANITKDAFLLKHVRRNKEGYVSLKLISSFKRVKHLTKDWRVVASALLRSKKLEINEAGTKLRRMEPLPQYDQTAPSRTVVAVNMPIEKATIENVAELFGKCGEIALVRILRPGNPVPADVRQFINKNPGLAGVTCALIEYTDSEYARKALAMQQQQDEYGLKVYELNNVPKEDKKKRSSQLNKKTTRSKSDASSSCPSSSETEYIIIKKRNSDPRIPRLRRGSFQHPTYPLEPATWLQRRLSAASFSSSSYSSDRRLSASSLSSGSAADMYHLNRRFSNCSVGSEYSTCSSRRMSSCSSVDMGCGGCNGIHCNGGGGGGLRSRSNSAVYHLPDNVVRMPQGPDGSKGFRQRLVHPTY